jgi:L-2,4-diaminobutyric acid acetyltransferase
MENLEEEAPAPLVCREPRLEDASSIHGLIEACKPLDLNSPYAYMLLCTHFQDTCVVAEHEGGVCGFVSGYRKPTDAAVLFVWQVAVGPHVRGNGVGKKLLTALLARPACAGATHVETTVTPSNLPSNALFDWLAREHGAPCERSTAFRAGDFGSHHHEEEVLLRIGPLKSRPDNSI